MTIYNQVGYEEIGDAQTDVFTKLIGRTIVSISRNDWPRGDDEVLITFDDGSKLLFRGWGHGDCGLDTFYKLP